MVTGILSAPSAPSMESHNAVNPEVASSVATSMFVVWDFDQLSTYHMYGYPTHMLREPTWPLREVGQFSAAGHGKVAV